MTDHEYLTILIENHADLTPDELAETIIDAGFVSVTGGMAAGVIEYAARQAELVIHNGDVAEVAAPPGSTGVGAAIDGRDRLYEEPVEWLRDLARKVTDND